MQNINTIKELENEVLEQDYDTNDLMLACEIVYEAIEAHNDKLESVDEDDYATEADFEAAAATYNHVVSKISLFHLQLRMAAD